MAEMDIVMDRLMNNNKHNDELLEILCYNKGFDNPERWLNYARLHSFKKREAVYCPLCPDCKGEEGKVIGQYIHFNQLVRLRKCRLCGLAYSDVLLDENFWAEYFEDVYKNETYFVEQRNLIYKGIISIISKLVNRSRSFTAIDIGGAKGHLSHLISSYFPKSDTTLTDISEEACRYAKEYFSLRVICCDIDGLKKLNKKYTLVLLIDSLYYSPAINDAWKTISQMVDDDGSLILRLPNKLWGVICCQKMLRLISSKARKGMQDKIIGINPEHIRFFSVRYLRDRISNLGFHSFTVYPSPPLLPLHPLKRVLARLFWILAISLYELSFGKVLITPSIIVTAKKRV